MDEAADMYDEAVNQAREHGFLHYEVSNYARSRDAMGRHNFSYWLGQDYLGIGPGAHGRLTTVKGERLRTFGVYVPLFGSVSFLCGLTLVPILVGIPSRQVHGAM